MTVLVLGGTSEARAVAQLLYQRGEPFVSSLAGRVAEPRLPVGPVRIGGFGGVEGLRAFLRSKNVTAVVDATHPFAEQITRHAFRAAQCEGVPYLRLERPGWSESAGAERWHWVEDHDGAARRAAHLGARPMLTIGRRHLGHFVKPLREHAVLARVVDRPEIEIPPTWRVLTSRGPYSIDGERAIMAEHGADVVVTKDSGGSYTRPKLDVADELGIAVVIVRRTPPPWTESDAVAILSDPSAVLDHLARLQAVE
ncbi:cobalt-precorrin-6A reductase [uncultured Aeromicrobium sp.]|uniref:cobalt-precorrin-6A reductase n=1 Tax=uncultured Aeromicrobium sp. TaxID=337820 RepID=UPI0025CCC711|nr:cobalt-precorrin-6A reductase [uncultured Aeromicrobium sp.]